MISHAEAAIAVVNAAGGHGYLADDIKRMPSTSRPDAYTEVYAMDLPDENERAGCLGLTTRRLLTRTVAKTQRKAEKEREAASLLGKSFTVGGESFGPLRRESGDEAITDDGDGFWSGVTTWVYA